MSRLFFEQLDDTLVNTLRNLSSNVKKIGGKVDTVLNSPITQLASASQPEIGIPIYAGATLGNKLFKTVGIVSDGLSGLIDRKNYKKKDSASTVVKNILERVSNTAKEVSGTGLTFY